MYKNNTFAIKLRNKQTDSFSQGCVVMQGNSLSPTLSNIYVNELAKTLADSTAPDIHLNDTEVQSILMADYLVLQTHSE